MNACASCLGFFLYSGFSDFKNSCAIWRMAALSSLLGQLGRKNVKFVDTALPFNPKNRLAHGGSSNSS